MQRRSIRPVLGAHPAKIARARELRRAMTPAETLLWNTLRGKSLGFRVRNQHVILGWIVDFYIASAHLVIEIDGDVHQLSEEEDARRTAELNQAGVRVMRFKNDRVLYALPQVVTEIFTAIHPSKD